MALAAGQQKITSKMQNKQEKDQSILGLLSAFLLIVFSSFSMNPRDTNAPVATLSLSQTREKGWCREWEHKIAIPAKMITFLIAS